MRVAFLGNHTVGVRALEAIAETEQVVGVVAHPADHEDGVRYLSVHDAAVAHGWPVLRATGKDPALLPFLETVLPDLLWATDYRYLLPPDVLALPPLGAVNLHPSLLPRYRGRAPINWAILEGEQTLGLTAHFVDEGLDTGDVIVQRSFELGPDEDVGNALEKLYPLYVEVTREVLDAFRAGDVPRRRQDHALATVFAARHPDDGLIRWSEPADRLRNLVRAVAHPYPGAFTSVEGRRLTIWSARALPGNGARPGTVVAIEEDGPVVQCGSGRLLLTEIESDARLREGALLGR